MKICFYIIKPIGLANSNVLRCTLKVQQPRRGVRNIEFDKKITREKTTIAAIFIDFDTRVLMR